MKDGRVTFRLEDGRRLDMKADDPQLRHLDHAWASTVHAFQGRTVDNVIAAMEAGHPQLTTQKMLYVEISRDWAELVTDDSRGLRERLEAATGERIAALEAIGAEKAKTLEAGRDAGQDGAPESKGPDTPERVSGPEAEKTRAPKIVDRALGL